MMYSPDNPILQPASMSFKALKKTIFEKLADFTKDEPGEINVLQLLESVKSETKDK